MKKNTTKSGLETFYEEVLNDYNSCVGERKAIALFTFINSIRKEYLPAWHSLEELQHDYRNEEEKALATMLFFLVAIKKEPINWQAYLRIYDETIALEILGEKFRNYLNHWVMTMMLLSLEDIPDEQKEIIMDTPSEPLIREMLKSMACS